MADSGPLKVEQQRGRDFPPEPLPLTTTVPPARVSRAAVTEALAALGLSTLDLVEATIEPRRITATYWRRDDEGKWVVAGNELATVRYFTSIKDD